MAEQRLPIVNNDDGIWGDIIRQYLMKEHVNDDTDNPLNGGHQKITIKAGTATAGTAPLKFTSGTLLSSPEAGAIEFAGDYFYATQTSSTTRKKIAMYNDAAGATGDIYYRDSGGYFTRLGAGSAGDILTIASGIPSWTASIVGKALDNTNTITVKDVNFTLQDDSDTTKQAKFQLSSIATGTTRTYTLPDASGTLLDNVSNQSIGGVKDFSSILYTKEVYVQPTGGAGNTASLTLDNDSGQVWAETNNSGGTWALWDQTHSKAPIAVQENSPDQALVINGSGVYVDDSHFTISNLADTSKSAQFDASAITTGTLRTFALPDANTTLVGTNVQQTLSSKTLSSPKINLVQDTSGNQQFTTSATDMQMSVDIDMNGHYLWNLTPPVDPLDAATKQYVDSAIVPNLASSISEDNMVLGGDFQTDSLWANAWGAQTTAQSLTGSGKSRQIVSSGAGTLTDYISLTHDATGTPIEIPAIGERLFDIQVNLRKKSTNTGGGNVVLQTMYRDWNGNVAYLSSNISTAAISSSSWQYWQRAHILTNSYQSVQFRIALDSSVPSGDTFYIGGVTISNLSGGVSTYATQTLTNKTIDGNNNTLTNVKISSLATTGTASASTFLRGDGNWTLLSGTGDASTNTTTSVIGEIALFADTAGKTLKRSTGSGIATLASGVLGTTAAPSGVIVGTTDA